MCKLLCFFVPIIANRQRQTNKNSTCHVAKLETDLQTGQFSFNAETALKHFKIKSQAPR